MGVIIVIVVCGVLFYASYSISSDVYLKSLCRNRNSSDTIAITFDDGVDAIMTPKVLDVLTKYNAKATFFIIGEKASRYPEIVRKITELGHGIGNHSYSHKWYFPMKSSAAIHREIEMCNAALRKATGDEIMLFRPPFGVTNPMVGSAVRKSGLQSIGWSIRSLDTIGRDVDKVKKRVVGQLDGGKIILLHDNRENADVLLESILKEIQNRGLKTVTIYELFNLKQKC